MLCGMLILVRQLKIGRHQMNSAAASLICYVSMLYWWSLFSWSAWKLLSGGLRPSFCTHIGWLSAINQWLGISMTSTGISPWHMSQGSIFSASCVSCQNPIVSF